MGPKQIPDADHVVRYCKPSSLTTSGDPTGASFQLRSGEKFLSVNWVEYFDRQTLADGLEAVRGSVQLALSKNGRIAILGVGRTRAHVFAGGGVTLRVDSVPVEGDLSHAGISGYTAEDDLIVELIAESLIDHVVASP